MDWNPPKGSAVGFGVDWNPPKGSESPHPAALVSGFLKAGAVKLVFSSGFDSPIPANNEAFVSTGGVEVPTPKVLKGSEGGGFELAVED